MATNLSHHQVEDFADIYRRVYGVELSFEEARVIAERLLNLIQAIKEPGVVYKVNRNKRNEH